MIFEVELIFIYLYDLWVPSKNEIFLVVMGYVESKITHMGMRKIYTHEQI